MSIETKKSATKPQTTVKKPTAKQPTAKQPTAKQPTAKQSTSQGKATTTAMPRPRAVLQRAQKDPSSLSAAEVDVLQRTIGLRAAQRMLGIPPPVIGRSPVIDPIQAKLTLGPAGDKYEQEADRTAKQVMNSLSAPAPTVQRHEQGDEVMQAKPLADGISRIQRQEMEEEELQMKPLADGISRLQRKELEDEDELQMKPKADGISRIQRAEMDDEEELQAKPLHGLEGGEVAPDVAATIGNAKGGGQPLHEGVRASMEQGFGADFSEVRVHTGGQADALNRSLNAKAFTTGNDIFFGKGQYNPGSRGGQELIAHELTHTVQQGAAGVQRHHEEERLHLQRHSEEDYFQRKRLPISHLLRDEVQASPIQRLIDRATMITQAGTPSKDVGIGPLKKRRGTEYKQILDLLDQYHLEAQNLWSQPAQVNAQDFRSTLHPILDQLTNAGWSYLGVQESSPRAPFIRDLVYQQIPDERKRVDKLAARTNFATLDRTHNVRETKDAEPVRVTNFGVTVGETKVMDQDEGGMADCHSMAVWLEIDAGNQPAQPDNAPPNSIYGVSLEYWENVEIAYNFTVPGNTPPQTIQQLKTQGEGATMKPWNDILSMQTDSPTWSKTGGPVTMSWTQAVTAASNRMLRGKHTIGFVDNPGVTPLAGKHLKRILRFRIVIKDGASQQEMYATQVIELDGSTMPTYKTYADSKGNQLAKERTQNLVNQQDDMTDMLPQDQRIAGGHGITSQILNQSVPNTARAEVRAFVTSLLAGTAAAFQNEELDNVRNAFNKGINEDVSGPYKPYSRMGKLKYGTQDDYYAIAGMNGLPYPRQGQVFHEHAIPNGGLLVAILEGGKITHMYYTDDQARQVGAKQIAVRSFAQIPLEQVTPYVHEQEYLATLSVPERLAFDQVKQAATARQNQQTQSVQAIGQVTNSPVNTLQYLRTHSQEYDLIEKTYNTANGANSFDSILKAYFDGQLQQNGANTGVYAQLNQEFRHEKAWAILRRAYIDELKRGGMLGGLAGQQFDQDFAGNRAAVGSAPALLQIVQNNANNANALTQAIVRHIKRNKGKSPTIENDYNTVIPPLNVPNAPATLGDLMNNYFTDQFQQRGNGVDVFAELMNDFPAFHYRIKPAYRNLFGDDQLQKVMQQMRKAEFAAAVPEPGSIANLDAKKAFLAQHFILPNFASSVAPTAPFDVDYDPVSQELKIIVKLAFDFTDNPINKKATGGSDKLAKINNLEVGKQYSKNQWTPQAKTQYISEFKKQVLGVWNPNTRPIECLRPGWEDVRAIPVFEIQDVQLGQEHNKVTVKKDVLQQSSSGQKKLSTGSSGWGAAMTHLHEYDVADKISDPTVHRYLHQPEKNQHIAASYRTDRTRIENRLRQFGKLAFQPGGIQLQNPARLPILVQELKRLGIPADLAKLHPIEVVGTAPGNNNLAGQRADTIKQALQTAGIENPLQRIVGAGNNDEVIVQAAAADPTIVDLYDKKWSRITAAHEFGHMIGLMDEYYGAKSDEVVKQMVSDGLLPPDTRGDHLTVNPPGAGQDEASGQAATMKLLQANDLSTPDFTLQDGAKSTSLMTGGYELWSQHFVTVWEALTTATMGHLESRFWKIS